MSLRILFAASEVFPLVKTGGLADVVGSLPPALVAQGAAARIAVPAYRGWQAQVDAPEPLLRLSLRGHDLTVWQATHPRLSVPLWLFDCAELFDRPGDPYHEHTASRGSTTDSASACSAKPWRLRPKRVRPPVSTPTCCMHTIGRPA